jgi:hypothetical protein
MGIKIYYYWYFDEVLNSMVLKYTNELNNYPNITKDTKTYTSIADAMKNAPKFAEVIHV